MQLAAAIDVVQPHIFVLEAGFMNLCRAHQQIAFLALRVGRRLVTVNYLSLINVMAGEEIVPEFLQAHFRPEAVAQAALELLDNVARRDTMRRRVAQVVATLGGTGASQRAAEAILLEAALAKAK